MLQSAVIDLLRIQNHTAPNTAPSAISIALATFVAILFPDILPYVAIGQILLALWRVGQEQNLRELKRAINAAQARIDVLLVTLD